MASTLIFKSLGSSRDAFATGKAAKAARKVAKAARKAASRAARAALVPASEKFERYARTTDPHQLKVIRGYYAEAAIRNRKLGLKDNSPGMKAFLREYGEQTFTNSAERAKTMKKLVRTIDKAKAARVASKATVPVATPKVQMYPGDYRTLTDPKEIEHRKSVLGWAAEKNKRLRITDNDPEMQAFLREELSIIKKKNFRTPVAVPKVQTQLVGVRKDYTMITDPVEKKRRLNSLNTAIYRNKMMGITNDDPEVQKRILDQARQQKQLGTVLKSLDKHSFVGGGYKKTRKNNNKKRTHKKSKSKSIKHRK
jgi:hypothetical protein